MKKSIAFAAFVIIAALAGAQATTLLSDTIFSANGSPATCSIKISWTGFQSADNFPIVQGNLTVNVVNGQLRVALIPNANTITPSTYYLATYSCANADSYKEYWVVPATSPTTLTLVRHVSPPPPLPTTGPVTTANVPLVNVPPDCTITATFTAASGRSAWFDNRTIGCTTWHFMYWAKGFSAISTELDYANDNNGAGSPVTWPDLDSGSLPLTGTASGQITGFKYHPWVSLALNSVTGTGSVTLIAQGYKPWAGQDANSSGGGAAVTVTNSITPYTACGSTKVHGALAAVPTSATTIQSATTCLLGITFFNSGSPSVMITLTDNQGSPISGIGAFIVPGNSFLMGNWPHGLELTNGFKLSSSGSATYSYLAVQ